MSGKTPAPKYVIVKNAIKSRKRKNINNTKATKVKKDRKKY